MAGEWITFNSVGAQADQLIDTFGGATDLTPDIADADLVIIALEYNADVAADVTLFFAAGAGTAPPSNQSVLWVAALGARSISATCRYVPRDPAGANAPLGLRIAKTGGTAVIRYKFEWGTK